VAMSRRQSSAVYHAETRVSPSHNQFEAPSILGLCALDSWASVLIKLKLHALDFK
jgi:hypothetical protein